MEEGLERSGWAALADPQFEPLPDWLEDLIAGQACTDWVGINWRRAASVPGAWFDQAKADAVVVMWPKWFKLTSNRFSGHPFRLEWWQEIIVRMLVGWKRPVEVYDPATGGPGIFQVRIYRELMLWVPRKNGKSEFLAALALLFWLFDGIQAGQGYVFARDEDQARKAFTRMQAMAKLLPNGEAGRVNVYGPSIYCPQLTASFQVLTGALDGKHGAETYVRFGDEMHEWRSTKIEDDLRQGSGTYLQPVGLKASTAGLKSNEVGTGLFELTQEILSGAIDDPQVLAVVFAADEGDDWLSEAVWHKANPNLDRSITLDYLRGEAVKAQRSKRAEATFRAYHLNQWVEDGMRWLNVDVWDKGAPDKKAWETRRAAVQGRKCWGGFDLSSSSDITAILWLFEPVEPGGPWLSLGEYLLPMGAIAHVDNKAARVRLERWIESGIVTGVPGDVIDHDFTRARIRAGFAEFDVQKLAFDRWKADKLITDLQKDGIDAERLAECPMGIRTLGEPSREFERLVLSHQLDHGGDPVLRWMARNVALRFDENLNFMPAKRRSAEKIDGIMAAVMALAASMAGKEPDSVYETRGPLVF